MERERERAREEEKERERKCVSVCLSEREERLFNDFRLVVV